MQYDKQKLDIRYLNTLTFNSYSNMLLLSYYCKIILAHDSSESKHIFQCETFLNWKIFLQYPSSSTSTKPLWIPMLRWLTIDMPNT